MATREDGAFKPWQRFVLELVRIWKQNIWNKLGYAVVLLGVSTLVGWVPEFLAAWLGIKFQQDKLIGVAVTALGLGMLIWGGALKKPPAAHDVHLLTRFRQLMTPATVALLRDHQFGNYFNQTTLQPLFDFADNWRGAESEFIDPILQEPFRQLLGSAQTFTVLVRLVTKPRFPGSDVMHIDFDPDTLDGELRQYAVDMPQHVGQQARAVIASLNAFEKAANSQIPKV